MSRAPIAMEARGGRLLPGDAWAEEQLAALPDGRYTARLSKQTRAGREEREAHRALWWAGCTLLANNSDSPLLDTSRKVHEYILMGLGFVRPRWRVDGGFDMVPVSTSEAEMDDEEFAILQEKARAYSIQRWGYDILAGMGRRAGGDEAMNKPVRPDWATNQKTRRFIFEVIVLRILWAIWWQVSGQPARAQRTIGMALLDTVDYVEANKINERSTRETIKTSFGWDA